MNDIEALMKRCQIGVPRGPNAYDQLHSILADCYGALGVMSARQEPDCRSCYGFFGLHQWQTQGRAVHQWRPIRPAAACAAVEGGRLTAERDALLAEVANLTEERKAVMILLTEVVFTNILTLADSDILQNKALRMIERMRGGRE